MRHRRCSPTIAASRTTPMPRPRSGASAIQQTMVKALFDAGVPIVAGTDGALPGYSLLRSIEMYVEAGLTPMQAIESATRVPAESMGLGEGHRHDRGGQARRHDRVERRSARADFQHSKAALGGRQRARPRTGEAVGRGRIQVSLTRRIVSRRAARLLARRLPRGAAASGRAGDPDPDLHRRISLGLSRSLPAADADRGLLPKACSADGLIPQFPSKTFPNHYTIVTGLTLAHHGIISNNMRAADIPGEFSLSNRDVLADPRWWGGEPIWNTAEKQGRKAGAMFWPGSETVIGGRQATYWTPFDDDMPNGDRVKRVLGWLTLPESERPSFLTLVFQRRRQRRTQLRSGLGRGEETRSCRVDKEIARSRQRREGRAASPIACTTSSSAITAWRRSAPIA